MDSMITAAGLRDAPEEDMLPNPAAGKGIRGGTPARPRSTSTGSSKGGAAPSATATSAGGGRAAEGAQATTPTTMPANYLTAAAPPPTKPPKKLCAATGFLARYKCTRCGVPYHRKKDLTLLLEQGCCGRK